MRCALRAAERRTLVENEPIQAQLANRFRELLEIHWLANIAVGAQVVTPDAIALFIGRGENHDREQLGAPVGAKTTQHFKTVELGQLQVEQDDFRERRERVPSRVSLSQQIFESLHAIARHHHLVFDVVSLEGPQRQQFVIGIVLNQEYDFAFHKRSSLSPGLREREIKRGPASDRAFGPDAPAMTVDDALHSSEANARAGKFIFVVETLEGAKQALGMSGIESGAIIAHE